MMKKWGTSENVILVNIQVIRLFYGYDYCDVQCFRSETNERFNENLVLDSR